jgi:DnaJ-like protein
MPEIIFGIVVLALLLWAAQGFANVDPRKLAPVLKFVGGIVGLAGALFMLARGELIIAIPLGLVALWALGWLPSNIVGLLGAAARKNSRPMSRVRSAFVEMELDHDSGAMRGRILAGRYDGVTLDTLDVATIAGFLPEIDDESRSLLMAYLDRRQPSWREHAKGDADTGQARPPGGGKMTEQEAYQILGLEPGARAEDIGRAHRTLMKKLHPDQGGSTYLAARVNEAKDILLRRHR